MSYEGPDSDVQAVPTVPVASSRPKIVHLKSLAQLAIADVAILVTRLKGVKTPALVIALSETGYVRRTKWSSGETKITQSDLDRMNRCLPEHSRGQFIMNNNFIWYTERGSSKPVN